MTKELSTKFDPTEVEAGRYDKWLAAGVFKPSGDLTAEPYSIVIPPPNVTGKLHLGHYHSCQTDARLRYTMVAWYGPCRDCDAS